jgi:YfiH family protein
MGRGVGSMFIVEESSVGRIVVPEVLPRGFGLFYTTRDLHGRLDKEVGERLASVLRERFGIDAVLATCVQVHGAAVTRATGAPRWRECDTCDALWADEKGIALGVKVADCLPVSLVDPAKGVIANIHSGWRGAVQRIVTATLDQVPIDRRGSFVYLGPSIRACCFEVGDEVATQFDGRFVDRSRPRAHVDLVAYTVDVLLNEGFSRERIFDSGLCTRCNNSIFHSYRRDRTGGGRNLAIVAR